jgi:hypothetical protein
MLDPNTFKPATTDEIADALSSALRYDHRRRIHDADTT